MIVWFLCQIALRHIGELKGKTARADSLLAGLLGHLHFVVCSSASPYVIVCSGQVMKRSQQQQHKWNQQRHHCPPRQHQSNNNINIIVSTSVSNK
jgi:hypothetical protein